MNDQSLNDRAIRTIDVLASLRGDPPAIRAMGDVAELIRDLVHAVEGHEANGVARDEFIRALEVTVREHDARWNRQRDVVTELARKNTDLSHAIQRHSEQLRDVAAEYSGRINGLQATIDNLRRNSGVHNLKVEIRDLEADIEQRKASRTRGIEENRRQRDNLRELRKKRGVQSKRIARLNNQVRTLTTEVDSLKAQRLALGYGMNPNRVRGVYGRGTNHGGASVGFHRPDPVAELETRARVRASAAFLRPANPISAEAAREYSLSEWRERCPANIEPSEWVVHYLIENGEPSSVRDILERHGAIVLTRAQFDALRHEADRNAGPVTVDIRKATQSGHIGGVPFVVQDRGVYAPMSAQDAADFHKRLYRADRDFGVRKAAADLQDKYGATSLSPHFNVGFDFDTALSTAPSSEVFYFQDSPGTGRRCEQRRKAPKRGVAFFDGEQRKAPRRGAQFSRRDGARRSHLAGRRKRNIGPAFGGDDRRVGALAGRRLSRTDGRRNIPKGSPLHPDNAHPEPKYAFTSRRPYGITEIGGGSSWAGSGTAERFGEQTGGYYVHPNFAEHIHVELTKDGAATITVDPERQARDFDAEVKRIQRGLLDHFGDPAYCRLPVFGEPEPAVSKYSGNGRRASGATTRRHEGRRRPVDRRHSPITSSLFEGCRRYDERRVLPTRRIIVFGFRGSRRSIQGSRRRGNRARRQVLAEASFHRRRRSGVPRRSPC